MALYQINNNVGLHINGFFHPPFLSFLLAAVLNIMHASVVVDSGGVSRSGGSCSSPVIYVVEFAAASSNAAAILVLMMVALIGVVSHTPALITIMIISIGN